MTPVKLLSILKYPCTNQHSLNKACQKGIIVASRALSKEMIERIEDFIKENPQASYKSIADFVTDAVRMRFERLGVYPGSISLLGINASEIGPLLYDKNLKKTVQIVVTPARRWIS